jgi:predicted PurR-regulated permease PerM
MVAPQRTESWIAPGSRPWSAPVPTTRTAAQAGLTDLALRTVVVVLVTILLVGLTLAIWQGITVLLEAFAGVLFALFLAAVSEWLSRHSRLSYHWSLAVTVVVLLLLSSAIGWLLSNRVGIQLAELTHRLPQSLEQIRAYLSERPWGQVILEQLPGAAGDTLTHASNLSRVRGIISSVANVVITIVVVLFVGIFGAAEPQLYRNGFLHLLPPPHRPRSAEALDAVFFNLRWWLMGQVFLMIAIGFTTSIGLWLIGVPLAMTLGLIAGLLEIIPYLGPWIAVVPASLMALLVSPWHLVETLALFLFIHMLEGYVLLPLVQRRVVLLPPALTLVMQLLLGNLLGLMGLMVAAPLTVTLVVLLKMLYVEDTLGDEAVDVPGEPGNEQKPAATAENGP